MYYQGQYRYQPTRAELLHALRAFIGQRPGLESANYAGAPGAYHADKRDIMQARANALTLLNYIAHHAIGLDADRILRASESTFRGRLSWDADRKEWHYAAGQYYPTEYRRAVCAVLAAALWDYWRDTMHEPTADKIHALARETFGPRSIHQLFH